MEREGVQSRDSEPIVGRPRLWQRLRFDTSKITSHHERLRIRVLGVSLSIGILGPILGETFQWIHQGHPATTLIPGMALCLTNLTIYFILKISRAFGPMILIQSILGTACIIGGMLATGGIESPIAIAMPMTIALNGLMLGCRGTMITGAVLVSIYASYIPQSLNPGLFLVILSLALTGVIWIYEQERLSFDQIRNDLFYIIDQSTDMIGIFRNGRITYMNRSFMETTGFNPQAQLVTREMLYSPQSREQLFSVAIPTAIESGSWSGEIALLNHDGQEIEVLQTVNVHHHSDSNVLYGSTVIKDISVFKAQERELESAKNAAETALAYKSQFLANMSHELRTPMNGVLGMAHLLRDEVKSPRAIQQLDALEASGRHLVTIVNDILDINKMESGQLRLDAFPFDPLAIVRESFLLFTQLAHDSDNEVELDVHGPTNLWINSDPARYRQVLHHLLSNALKFTSSGTVTVRVDFESIDTDVRLKTSVIDTGIGIPRDKVKTIFKPFEQVDSSDTRKYGGTGLGLTICNNVVQLLGGQLSVDSVVNEGSTFSFEFQCPSAPAPHQITDVTPLQTAAESPLPERVLVAEDNPVNQMVVGGMLKKLGIGVQFANNGLELLDLLKKDPHDVILMDCHMPEMDGFEATETIQSSYPPDVRPIIIALTASTMDEDRQRCFQCGMSDFLAKPVQITALKAALQRATSHQRFAA